MQTGNFSRGLGRCQAIPDQHAVDLLVSSSGLSALLDGQAAQALHHSAAAVQVLYLMQALMACLMHTAGNFRLSYRGTDAANCLQVVGDLADIDAKTAKLLATILQPFLSIGILLMVVRIILSWYPQVRSLSPVPQQCRKHSPLRGMTAGHADPGQQDALSVAYKPTAPILGPAKTASNPASNPLGVPGCPTGDCL